MKKTIKLLAQKKYDQALARALTGAKQSPSDPKRLALLLLSLSIKDKKAFNIQVASQVLDAFCKATDLSGAITILSAFLKAKLIPDETLLSTFLDSFATQESNSIPNIDFQEYDYDDEDEHFLDLISESQEFLSTVFITHPPASPPRSVPLFRSLNEEELGILLEQSNVIIKDEGQYFMREGDTSDAVYFLGYGKLKVLKGGDSDKYFLGYIRPGSFFGEMALVTSGPRTASVKTEEPSVALEIPSEVFESLVVDNPQLAKELTTYTRVRLLKNLITISPLFSPIPKEKRPEVIQSFKAKVYEPGDFIVKQGHPSKGLYMIASGEVYISKNQKNGEPIRVATLGPGEVVGEMSLIRGGNASADVIAGEDGAVVMFLSREKFNDLTSMVPELLSQVFHTALQRSEFNEQIEDSPEEPIL